MKKLKQLFLLLLMIGGAFTTSCKYNSTEFEPPNEGDKRIYGNIDGPPKQADNSYPGATDETNKIQKEFRKEIRKGIEN